MNWKNKIVYNSRWIGQIWAIMALVSIFNMNAFIALSLRKQFYIKNMIPVFLLWVLTGVVGYYLIRYAWNDVIRSVDIRKWFREHKYLILVVVISSILRIPMLNTLPKWDAGEYYFRLGTACYNYNFTFSSFFENFRLCNHSNLGFSFFYAIAEFLFPTKQIGVLSLNLIITELAIVCIYILIKQYWLHVEEWIVALITFVVSCTPLFLGTFAYFNVDYFLLLAFVFLVYFEYRQYNILMAFAAIILSQTKETGVVLVAAYLGSKMLVGFIQGHVGQRIVALCRKPYTWAALVSGALYIAEMKLMGSVTGWTQMEDSESPIRWSNTGFNCFGFNVDYIVYKLKQLFVLNLSWVIGIIFTVCAVILLFRLKRLQKDRAHRLVYVIIVMIAFTLFSVLYITYTLPRYNIFFNVLFALFTLCMLYVVIGRFWHGRIFGITVSVIGVLFLIQSFWNIDGISAKCFDTIDIGNGHKMIFSSYQSSYLGDGLVTNYQYTWIDQAIDKMLREANYDKESVVIEPKEEYATYVAGNLATYYLGWNNQAEKRKMENDYGSIIQHRTIEGIYTMFPYRMYDYNKYSSMSKHAIIYFLPYYNLDEKAELDKLQDICYIGPRRTVKAYGGEIAYYELVAKTRYRNFSVENLINENANFQSDKIEYSENLFDGMRRKGWSQSKVDEYYKSILCQLLKVKKYKKKQNVISKYDQVIVDVALYDEQENLVPAGATGFYAGHYENILVGGNIFFTEIDSALEGAKIGKTINIYWDVPDDYYLYNYRGQSLRVEITPRKITGYVQPDQAKNWQRKKAYRQAFNTVWNYYAKSVWKDMAMGSYNSNIYTNEEIKKQRSKIKKYYDEYLKTIHKSEEEYLNDYVKISKEEFETGKENMAKARCMWKYWKVKYEKQGSQIRREMYRKGLEDKLLKDTK